MLGRRVGINTLKTMVNASIRRICGLAYRLLAQSFKLHNVGREDCTPVSPDEIQLLSHHVETISIDDEEHALVLCDIERKTGESQHVLLPAEPWANDKDVQAREQCGELLAQRRWRSGSLLRGKIIR